jgi:polyhydroxyalkanoate synthesis regulator phasin
VTGVSTDEEGNAMQDSLRTYLGLAMGLTETSRKKVRKTVKDVVGRSNATAEQVKTLTSDLLAANSTNREALVKLVKFEVDRALGVVGLATAEEVAELTGRLRALEAQLREVEMNGPAVGATRTTAATRTAAAKRTTARKSAPAATTAVAKKTAAAAKTAPAKKATAARTTKATATKATTAKTTAAKAATAAKKATATKKATARKAPARATAAQA